MARYKISTADHIRSTRELTELFCRKFGITEPFEAGGNPISYEKWNAYQKVKELVESRYQRPPNYMEINESEIPNF